jgi:hypothetical protein
MCDRCEEIDVVLERYRRLKGQVSDRLVNESLFRMITELEHKKADLHRDGRKAKRDG